MATPTQYEFQLREVAAALMKQQGIHEGRWQLAFNLTANFGNFGMKAAEARPGAMFVINLLALQRQDKAPDDAPLVFDAAKENPK